MLQVFDRVMISRSELTLLVLTLIVLFFYGVQAFSEWYRSRLTVALGLRLDRALNDPVFKATFRDQLQSSGRSPIQAFSDLTVVRQWLTGQGVYAFFDLPWAPLYLAVMYLLHPALGWLTVLFMAILAGVAWWTDRATSSYDDDSQDEERELNSFIHTKLRNAEVIEVHGMVPPFLAKWEQRQHAMLSAQTEAHDVNQRFNVGSKEVRMLMQSLALGAGALLAIEGEITYGAMIAASLLMGRATAPIDQIVSGWRGFMNVRKCFLRVEKLLTSTSQNEPSTGPVQGSDAKGAERATPLGSAALSVRNLSVSMPGRAAPILKEISADFEAGKVYVMMGSSGAGKSTLAKALLGIVPPSEGEVLLNGQPVHRLDRAALGPSIGYVPQDIELFGGTAGQNIARMDEPDPDEVIAAAKLTGTHDLILRLPKGYDTPIGDAGSHLSGGQRQRLALARAVYRSPKLVVLDEPNANLDEAGERALAQTVKELRNRGSTVFLISHRPTAVALADRIIIMGNGRIKLFGERDEVRRQFKQAAQQGALPKPATA
jgi:ATP-binding cassette subfamily C exporter for protease/lipase